MRPILSIQILRGLAALAVVVTHFDSEMLKILSVRGAVPGLSVGAAGVDLFFVISGFVMVYASEPLFGRREGPLIFFSHRVARIVPTYWLATTLYVLIAALMPAFGKGYSLDFVVSSYLFIPAMKAGADIEPVVGQGWTLNYEMFFYLVFALAVLATRLRAALIVTGVLAALVALVWILPPLPVPIEFWGRPIILEFACGMMIALAHRAGFRIPAAVSVALILVGLVLFPLIADYVYADDPTRVLKWGLPATLVIAAAAFGHLSPPTGRLWSGLLIVGDASYALYLFHPLATRVVLYGVRWSGLDGAKLYWPLMIVVILASVALAIAIHFLLERPTTRTLRRYLTRYEPAWKRVFA